MAVYPNINTIKFCDWLLNYSWFKFTTSQTNTINTVYTAALTGASVTDTQYNNFILTTSWRYKYFEVFNNGINYQGTVLSNWLNLLKVQPSAAYISALNTLINTLTTDNNIQYLDRLWIFASENEEQALLSIINPSVGKATKYGSPVFTPNQGYTGSTNNVVNLNFQTAFSSTVYSLNSASFGFYSRTNSTSSAYDIGETLFTGPWIILRTGAGATQFGINSGSTSASVLSDSLALFALNRTSSTSVELWQRGVKKTTVTLNSSSMSPSTLCAAGVSGASYSSSGRQTSIVFIGSAGLDHLKLYNALQTFATSRGFNV